MLLVVVKDSFSDVLMSIGILILLSGVLLFKFVWLDSVVSIVIGFFIFVVGL